MGLRSLRALRRLKVEEGEIQHRAEFRRFRIRHSSRLWLAFHPLPGFDCILRLADEFGVQVDVEVDWGLEVGMPVRLGSRDDAVRGDCWFGLEADVDGVVEVATVVEGQVKALGFDVTV